MQQQAPHFQTSDFVLATTLASLDFKLEGLDHSDSRRINFCFRQTPELDEAVKSFWRGGEVKVDPRIFVMNQKFLKSRLLSR